MTLEIAESDPVLRRAFVRWNDKYFGGKLPDTVILWFEPMECLGHIDDGIKKAGRQRGLTKGERDEFYIRIDPAARWAKSRWGLDLLHEMAHLSCYPDFSHGKKFQREMLRLAQIGAFKTLW